MSKEFKPRTLSKKEQEILANQGKLDSKHHNPLDLATQHSPEIQREGLPVDEINMSNPIVNACSKIKDSEWNDVIGMTQKMIESCVYDFQALISALSKVSDDYLSYDWRQFLSEAKRYKCNTLNESTIRRITTCNVVKNAFEAEQTMVLSKSLAEVVAVISAGDYDKKDMDNLDKLSKWLEKRTAALEKKGEIVIFNVPPEDMFNTFLKLIDLANKMYLVLGKHVRVDNPEESLLELLDAIVTNDPYIDKSRLKAEIYAKPDDPTPYKDYLPR